MTGNGVRAFHASPGFSFTAKRAYGRLPGRRLSGWPGFVHRFGVAGGVVGVFLSLTVHAADVTIRHHDLQVELRPATHTIIAHDTIALTGGLAGDPSGHADTGRVVRVRLHQDLAIEDIVLTNGVAPLWNEDRPPVNDRRGNPDAGRTRTIAIRLPPGSSDAMRVRVSYRGHIQDAPTASPGLRFVRPDKTRGYIGEEGVYLTSETAWYPDIPGSFATFRVTVTVPAGWRTVTHGREVSFARDGAVAKSEWSVQAQTEALTLAANRFVKRTSQWNGVEIATYLFPEDAHLSDQYVQAVARYLEWFTALLGPYPFPKFAVVENFFPSGIGLPSFTLLGDAVIKRGYTQPYSLGHEIVHSWLGNSVHNHVETGNWVEGLTTYLANYYYDERVAGDEAALAHRRRMLMEYSLYVRPADDYPVAKFHHKETRADNAIGYHKTAMIFHMLRRHLGDPLFFDALRAVVADYTGRYADWPQLRRAFEETSGRDLSWFFPQWVDGVGAPDLRIVRATVTRDPRTGYWVDLHVKQTGSPYRLHVPVVVRAGQEPEYRTRVDIRGQEQRLALWVPARPDRLRLDPEYQTFRRVARRAMPPMLNGWVTAPRRAVLLSSAMLEHERQAFKPALDRIRSHTDKTTWLDERTTSVGARSVLAMGTPRTNPWVASILRWCGPRVRLSEQGITIEGVTYAGNRVAVLVNCANPLHAGQVGTVFFGFSHEAVRGLSRLLFFYGWDSYCVFDEGRVVARGMFEPPTDDLTVVFRHE